MVMVGVCGGPDAMVRRTTNEFRQGFPGLTFRTSGYAFRLSFPGAVSKSGERAVGGLGDVQKAEDLALQIGKLGVEQLHGMAGLR